MSYRAIHVLDEQTCQIGARLHEDELIPVIVANVHSQEACAGQVCVIHNPTEHHMSTWPLNWRDDRGIVERLCSHGVGHPDPDQWPHWQATNRMHEQIHGCCGCCAA